ncbi:hypothetical protein D3C75_1074500 [compost metagenome]
MARLSRPSSKPLARATRAAAQATRIHSSNHSKGNNSGRSLMPGMAKQNCSLNARPQRVARAAPSTRIAGAPQAASINPPQASPCSKNRTRLSYKCRQNPHRPLATTSMVSH